MEQPLTQELLDSSIHPIRKVEGATEVRLKNHSLTNVALLRTLDASVRRLDLSMNQLTTVHGMKSLSEVTWVSLAHNALEDIRKIIKNKRVQVLNISHNKVDDIHFLHKLKELKAIVANNNSIAEFVCRKVYPELNTIVLSHNPLHTLTLGTHTPQLVKLSASNCALSAFPDLSHTPHLAELRLTNNAITTIPAGTFAPLTRLKVLDIGKNQLSHLSELEELSGLEHLRNVNLAGNPLAREEDYTDKALGILPQIHYLDGHKLSQRGRPSHKHEQLMQMSKKGRGRINRVIRLQRERGELSDMSANNDQVRDVQVRVGPESGRVVETADQQLHKKGSSKGRGKKDKSGSGREGRQSHRKQHSGDQDGDGDGDAGKRVKVDAAAAAADTDADVLAVPVQAVDSGVRAIIQATGDAAAGASGSSSKEHRSKKGRKGERKEKKKHKDNAAVKELSGTDVLSALTGDRGDEHKAVGGWD